MEGVGDILGFILQEFCAAYSYCSEEESNDHPLLRPPTVCREKMDEVVFISGFSVYRESQAIMSSVDNGIEDGSRSSFKQGPESLADLTKLIAE